MKTRFSCLSAPWRDHPLDEELHTSTQCDVKDEVLWLKESIDVATSSWVVCNGFPER
jgi:hypothetical protein